MVGSSVIGLAVTRSYVISFGVLLEDKILYSSGFYIP